MVEIETHRQIKRAANIRDIPMVALLKNVMAQVTDRDTDSMSDEVDEWEETHGRNEEG